MAREGYVIGFAETTSTNPTLYWNGELLDDSIDDALLFTSLPAARAEAGRLQTAYTEYHVEPYASARTIAHTPALPVESATASEGI